eukprot:TRINITY_DN7043_c0_g1_i14.p1 TRINITY_DN7043_c0_g1~~TRINITY_DN7043_c0_g1_i14.p1  ORF type:complete len:415 (-),score=33.21 TRINITY_DN7043_c0_g1_i14:169-1413(-)
MVRWTTLQRSITNAKKFCSSITVLSLQIASISVGLQMITQDWAPLQMNYQYTNDEQKRMKILVITHGLTGGSDCNYIRAAVLDAQKAGFRAVVVNNRGIAKSKLKTPKIHDHSCTNDLSTALKHIKKRYPEAAVYGMGISMGGNLMLKYAGEKKDHSLLEGIVTIGNPFDLLVAGKSISKRPFWDYVITRNFIWLLKQHIEAIEPAAKEFNVELDKALNSKTTREFDEYLTRRIHGFSTVDNMYREIGCKPYLPYVTVPTLMINCVTDPISPPSAIPYEEVKVNPNLVLMTTKRGGHVDWFTGTEAKRWVYTPGVEFLTNVDRRTKSMHQQSIQEHVKSFKKQEQRFFSFVFQSNATRPKRSDTTSNELCFILYQKADFASSPRWSDMTPLKQSPTDLAESLSLSNYLCFPSFT